ncbi:hypothetical protein Phum_PHUM452770 [Pediculus humanus corporis]|uniref:Protein phosphatase 1 regulatory subunit 36 n=1 Tax=Pediculus humanus subsp. corporis TaxID=121224 RepID=E0VUP0_PEDHC|nr:uncharacterized protein Phum_PHUM452770 [Pediculus humanus corporis]EEB17096.1 hypothetical protein Phum_PHUM452770 [Pediculus humanus corporis]
MSISSLLFRGLKGGQGVWNDINNELELISLTKEKKLKKKKEKKRTTGINGLTYATMKVDLTFKSTVSDVELMNFRHYLKKKNLGREDHIVTIQDIKIVAMFLCMQPLPTLFYKFFNVSVVNQLLRSCIVYLQFFFQTCETVVKTQQFLKTNRNSRYNPSSHQSMKEDLDDLRVLIGRFYAAVIFSELSSIEISKTDEIIVFECFLKVSTIVVWIALERKYLNTIRIELERIFRTVYFNNFDTTSENSSYNILNEIKKESFVVLHGKISEFDKRKNQGITIGILGLQRRLFDPLLYPCSKRVLKLLITSSPMDVSDERKLLRENAIKKAQRESEPQPPHVFDDLPRIPRPKKYTISVEKKKLGKAGTRDGGDDREKSVKIEGEGSDDGDDDDDDDGDGDDDKEEEEELETVESLAESSFKSAEDDLYTF